MIVTILGSGSALPTARRASAGYLVEWSGGQLIMDCSAGTYMRALKAGLDPDALRGLVLSHFHPDHTADLEGLFFARMQEHRPPLPVAGPEGTAALLARFAPEHYEVRSYPCEFDGLSVAAFPGEHSPEASCLRLVADGKTLAFSGDTSDCSGVREACRGADLALIECSTSEPKTGHMTPDDCRAVIADAQPKRALLTHIAPDLDTGDLPLAEDGMVVAL